MARAEEKYMGLALRLARRGAGLTSPNPMVGAVLVRSGEVIGRGWHAGAGGPHAEIEALRDAARRGHAPRGSTLYVTLEPCCTQGRTPPCTEAILRAGIRKVVVGAIDPNPRHCGRGFRILETARIAVKSGVLAEQCASLNEAFNHWIVHRTPFVTVKAAMTLDGKIATASGESKWVTGNAAREFAMNLRSKSDAILVGVNTILADNPRLTVRQKVGRQHTTRSLRRIVLDANARTPLSAKVVSDEQRALTSIVVSRKAPAGRVARLAKHVRVLRAPSRNGMINLSWLLEALGAENVTSLLVEGGGEVNASFILQGLVHRVAFFYAPKILGGCHARKAVAGLGASALRDVFRLNQISWTSVGKDWLLAGKIC